MNIDLNSSSEMSIIESDLVLNYNNNYNNSNNNNNNNTTTTLELEDNNYLETIFQEWSTTAISPDDHRSFTNQFFTTSPVLKSLSPSSPSFFHFPTVTSTICKECRESEHGNISYENMSIDELINNNNNNNNVTTFFHSDKQKNKSPTLMNNNDDVVNMSMNIGNGMTENRRINVAAKNILQAWILEHQNVY
jgi:hypothetical protein